MGILNLAANHFAACSLCRVATKVISRSPSCSPRLSTMDRIYIRHVLLFCLGSACLGSASPTSADHYSFSAMATIADVMNECSGNFEVLGWLTSPSRRFPPPPPFSLPVCEEKRKAGCITDRARRQCDPMSDTCLAELYGVERRKDKFYLKRSQLRLRCTQGRVRGPIPPPHPSFCSLCLLALTHKAKPGRWQKLTLICFSLVRSFRRCGEAGYLRCQESPGPRPGSEVFLMRGCITRAGWRGHTVVHELLWGSGSLLSA